jgi:glycolate oxidase
VAVTTVTTTGAAELADALGPDSVLTDPDVTASHVVVDGSDADQRARAVAAFDAIRELGLPLGGTITGEHGVGTLEADWLEREIGPVSADVHRSIKDALDPSGLLDPGEVLRRRPPATA